jgi:hypothetical protein
MKPTTMMMIANDPLAAKVPYYNPILLFGLASLAIGAGLDTTLDVSSYAGEWAGYQIFCGLGFALIVQMVSILRDILAGG